MDGDVVSEKLLGGWRPPREGEERGVLGRRAWEESKRMWVVAGPAMFTACTTFGLSVITQAFIGHVGSVQLAAYALVSTVLVRFANGILWGMASALGTLCGQAYGAKQYHMLGVNLQRSWIILLSSVILLLPLYIFTTPLLRLLGQEEAIVTMAGTISLWFIPMIFSFVFAFTFQIYLQAQSKNKIIAYLAGLSLTLHVLLSWILVTQFSMGVAGALFSMILAMWAPVLALFAYVFCGGCPDTWKGFSASAFTDLWTVIRLSLSSGIMICLELWYNTILVLLTGHMGNAEIEIDALSICLSISACGLMISLGFLAAASVRVGNELGAGSAKAAKFSVTVVVTTSLLIGVALVAIFLLFQADIAYIFTDNAEVVEDVADLSPLLAFSMLLNSVQPVLSGVAIGAGRQVIVAFVNVTCYYVIGIPVGAVLGYVFGYDVKGIWIGMLLGTAVQTIVLIYITWRTDWDKQVSIALARVNKFALPTSDEIDGAQDH